MRKIILTLMSWVMVITMNGCSTGVTEHEHEHEHSHDGGEIVIEPEKAQTLGIKVVTVEKKRLNSIIKVSGRIENDMSHSWNIVADCSGKVIFLGNGIIEGKEVHSGEPLFKINSEGMNLANNASQLEKSRANVEYAKAEYEKTKLLKKDRLATESELLSAKKEYETAESDYKRLSSAANKKILAPGKGFITSVQIENGQYVEEGTTIATISTGKDLIVEAFLPSRHASHIGDIAGANFVTGTDNRIYTTEKRTTSSDIVSGNGTFIPVHFLAEKSDGLVMGIPVTVYIKLNEGKDALTVPKSAISERFGKYFVYRRLDEDCYAEANVTIGQSDGIDVEITSGIKEGDDIVTEGVYFVKAAGSSTSIPHGHSH